MILPPEESVLFFKLYKNLLLFTNSHWQLYENLKTVEELDSLGIKRQVEIRNKLYEDVDIIDEFCKSNAA